MNRKELELRMESLKKQQRLTSKAIEDTQKQIDNITAEENFKETQKAIKKFLRFKGKIIVWQVADWKSYMFKCKDIVPRIGIHHKDGHELVFTPNTVEDYVKWFYYNQVQLTQIGRGNLTLPVKVTVTPKPY